MKTGDSMLSHQISTKALRNLVPPSALDPYNPKHLEGFIDEARAQVRKAVMADAELSRTMEALKSGELNFLYIENAVPADEHSFRHEFVIVGIAETLGEIFAYEIEYGGALIQHLVPDIKHASEMSSRSYEIALPLHTDGNHIPDPGNPNFLLLLCRNSEPTAGTVVCPVEYVVDRLDAATQEILGRDYPSFPADIYGNGAPVMLPMLVMENGHPYLRVGPQEKYELDEERAGALARLRKALEDARKDAHEIYLKTGDLLIFNNHRCLHGRTSFQYHKESKRHMLRVFVTQHLEGMRAKFPMRGRIQL